MQKLLITRTYRIPICNIVEASTQGPTVRSAYYGLQKYETRDPFADAKTHDYTPGMKTAISIPDEIYSEAEQLSRRLKKSRSQIYTEAVAEYIARHDPEAVTEAMNRVCEMVDTRPDPALGAAVRRTLEAVEW